MLDLAPLVAKSIFNCSGKISKAATRSLNTAPDLCI